MKQKFQEIIGTQQIENGRLKKDLKALKEGKCTTYRPKAGNICCKQMKTTAAFQKQQTSKTYKLYNANCKTEYTIYLMECIICNLQYASKNETPFKIRLNNHRKDVKNSKAILADKHFKKKMVIDLTNTQDS